MRSDDPSIATLLSGVAVLLVGMGLMGTLLGIRAGIEGFSQTVTGAVMSAYFAGYILGTFLCPAVIRRVGHIRSFAAMAAVASTTAIAHAILVDPFAWGLLRVITGTCMVGLFMVVESWLNTVATHQQRGRVLAVYMATTLVAMAAGQFLLLAGSVSGFVHFGLVAILLSLSLVPIAVIRVREPTPVEAPKVGLIHLYRTSPTGVAGSLVAGLISGAFWGMGAVFAHDVGFSNSGVALFMSVTIVGGAVLQWPIGRYSDSHDRRRVLLAICLIGAGLAGVAFLLTGLSRAGLLTTLFFYGGISFTVYALSVAHVNDLLSPTEVLEATSGLLLVYGVGAAAGPLIAGSLMELYGARSLLSFFAVCLTSLAVFTYIRVRTHAPVPTEEQSGFVPLVRTSPAALEMDPRADVEPELELGPGQGP